MIKSNSFGKSSTHLLRALIIKYVLLKPGLSRIFVNILDKATYEFTSSKRLLST